jgi:uncharacterized membrane protein YvlD (DUF360 family)
MILHSILTGFALPSGFYILLGFFALIVLAIVLWSGPKQDHEKAESLKRETVDSAEPKK